MKTTLIYKELDLIDATITRLDTQLQQSKNFCVILWTAWLGWFIESQLTAPYGKTVMLICGAAFFPLFFWLMDYKWRKALLSTSLRQKRITVLLNSHLVSLWLQGEINIGFPLLDPVGWLYGDRAYSEIFEKIKTEETYNGALLKKEWATIATAKSLNPINVLFYKEAKWFYPILIIIPIVLGLFIF